MGFDDIYDSLSGSVEGPGEDHPPDLKEEVIGDVEAALVTLIILQRKRDPNGDYSVNGDLYKSVLEWLPLAAERAFSQE